MHISFSTRFPSDSKALVSEFIERFAIALGLTEWEFVVRLNPQQGAAASVGAAPESHSARVRLRRDRLSAALLGPDLMHELLHVSFWHTLSEILDLPAAHRKKLMRVYEEEHDCLSRVLLRLVSSSPPPLPSDSTWLSVEGVPTPTSEQPPPRL